MDTQSKRPDAWSDSIIESQPESANNAATTEAAPSNVDSAKPSATPDSSTPDAPSSTLTAGGYPLPSDWLARVALIWGGYAASAFAGSGAC